MMKAYYGMKFNDAITFCEELARCFDGELRDYYDIWMQRCRDCINNVPEDWDGVFRATSK